MKNYLIYYLSILLFASSFLYGDRGYFRQQQESTTHILDGFDSKTISTNTMSINLTNVNSLNWFIEGSYIGVEWLSGNNYLVFTHGLWLTGMADDSLIGTTSSWGLAYSPGPIIDGQAAMIAQPNDSTEYRIYHIDQNSGPGDSDYDEWPVHWGAPSNPDGSPKIYGDQTAFMIYNDAHPSVELRGLPESDATPIEIHETVWSYDENVNLAVLDQTIFFRYQLFNRGSTDINEASLALWTDLDIYHASANWGGYNTNGNYAYNYLYQDGYDGYIPRAIAYVLLQGPLAEQNGETGIAFGHQYSDKTNLGTTASWFIVDDSPPVGDGDILGVFPDELEQLRNITLGLMPNGDPIVHPITGEITPYTHDGNPATGEGWLWAGGAGGGAGFVSSSSNYDLFSGDSTEAIYAMVVALGDSFSDALVNLENQVMDLRDWWEENQLDIYDENYEQIPDSFELLNAYPNPFNPTTNIQINVRSESDISLQILDISGRTVETLLNGIVPMGRQDIQWNPQNHASGIYFIHLTSKHKSQSKKIVYLK
ncbi:MAG: T9SS type A sorting domain-containing protein [Candidatus Marinimicrobia bacterium]|nr:T9SS type A sorting domain-containing protein [Candidatus Neomarinimicrobiota bacterium]